MSQKNLLKVNSDLTALDKVQAWFQNFYQTYCQQISLSKQQYYRLNLALAEGFTNAVRHAHRDKPPETPIELELGIEDDRLEIRIWDYGAPFNPDAVKEPEPGTLKLHWGWFLLRRLADRVTYDRDSDDRNCLIIVQHASPVQS